ncbi:Amino acid permease family protein [Candida parapsilosis]|uniref:Amino acid permease family protein n=1 Tax=Candida parapsilosis TaxID=5480 RepID=A0A8X7NQZ8_CANPA|nr:Amino acid permease family protein [Candida parapsilosis]KAF6056805.1 Amino acid permease family protein [Candida parapsilosis]KAF6059740.1 Amino acid permease family protein [Candida parapsilosis]KAF6068493.1 Amino acid permease family protein [Candida parapsilosis]
MTKPFNKPESYWDSHSIGEGEFVHDAIPNRISSPANIRSLDNIAIVNDKEAAKALKEAQANLEFSTETGYAPELRRNFNMLSLIGVGFGITNSWAGISGSLITGIASGGPMMIVYGIIIVSFFSMCVVLTLAEMASAFPNASGQIYWTMKLAPRKYSRLLAYITGVLSWAGSVFTSASITVTISVGIVGMYALFRPTFVVHKWQVFVVYEIFNILVSLFNIYDRPLPTIFVGTLGISILSFIIIIITVLAMHKGDFESAKFVFVDFQNQTGWSSAGIAFIVGLINPNWSFNGLDAATHIAEESLNPAVDIPIALISTVIIGFVTTFSYCIAIFFCIRNLEAVLTSNTGIPILDILHQATDSKAAALGLGILVIVTAVGCNIGCHTWSARICWGFARDNGLPFSKFWAQVNHKTGTTVNAHFLSCFWVGVIGCIYLGSDTAFNSILVSCVMFLLLSYMVPTLCLIFKRNQIQHGPFWLNKVGLVCNIVLVIWTIFTTVFYNFPSVMPVNAGNMNYSSAVFGVVFVLFFCDWIVRGRREFVDIEERERHKDDLTHELSNQVSRLEVLMSHTSK